MSDKPFSISKSQILGQLNSGQEFLDEAGQVFHKGTGNSGDQVIAYDENVKFYYGHKSSVNPKHQKAAVKKVWKLFKEEYKDNKKLLRRIDGAFKGRYTKNAGDNVGDALFSDIGDVMRTSTTDSKAKPGKPIASKKLEIKFTGKKKIKKKDGLLSKIFDNNVKTDPGIKRQHLTIQSHEKPWVAPCKARNVQNRTNKLNNGNSPLSPQTSQSGLVGTDQSVATLDKDLAEFNDGFDDWATQQAAEKPYSNPFDDWATQQVPEKPYSNPFDDWATQQVSEKPDSNPFDDWATQQVPEKPYSNPFDESPPAEDEDNQFEDNPFDLKEQPPAQAEDEDTTPDPVK